MRRRLRLTLTNSPVHPATWTRRLPSSMKKNSGPVRMESSSVLASPGSADRSAGPLRACRFGESTSQAPRFVRVYQPFHCLLPVSQCVVDPRHLILRDRTLSEVVFQKLDGLVLLAGQHENASTLAYHKAASVLI